MTMDRWIWISGWGLPPEWFQQQAAAALPQAQHTVIPPGPDTVASIDWSEFDRVGGYSFGAFLLLKQAERVPLPATLIAPFFAFPAEAGLGGKSRQTQVRFLARWFKRAPLEALADFYVRAGLTIDAPNSMPYETEQLAWGLDQLAHVQAPARLPKSWSGFVGDHDPLLDAAALLAAEPSLQIIPGAGHHPAPLLAAIQ